MRRDSRFKKALGYSRMIEVPAPIYLQAALLGIVDVCPKGFYYVLPTGERNIGPNYVRCSHVDPHIYHYVPTVIKPWNDFERAGLRVSIHGGTQKVLEFLRGRLAGKRELFIDAQEGRQYNLMRLYLEQMVHQMESHRDWNLTLDDFVFHQVDAMVMEWMLKALNSDVFEIMQQRHRIYVTDKDADATN